MLHTFSCGKPLDFETAVLGANPDYHSSQDFRRNCQRCVAAFEMRRRGYPVTAMPNPFHTRSGTYSSGSFSGSECFINPVREWFRNGFYDAKLMREAFIAYVSNFPPGSRWAISWRHPEQKLSHIIIGEKQDSEFRFGDPQSGKIGIDSLGLANPVYGYWYFRMDYLALKETFEWQWVIKEEIRR